MPIPLPRAMRATISVSVTGGSIVAFMLAGSAPAPGASGKTATAPTLNLKVNYVRAHDGPIDCQRAPVFRTTVFGFLRRGVAATSKRLKQIEADYRPRPGATLTTSGQRFDLTYKSSRRSIQGRQVYWTFELVPVAEAAGEAARRATVRYKAKAGSQKLTTVVFAEGCV